MGTRRNSSLRSLSVVHLLLLATATLCAQPIGSLRITNVIAAEGGVRLGWENQSQGTTVTLQYQDGLMDGIWRVPADFELPGNANQWTDAGAATNGSRFYRAVAVSGAERGKVVSGQLVSAYTPATLQLLFALAGVPVTPQYGVRLYRIVYETISPLGEKTLASGAFCVPDGAPAGDLPLVSYQHGTITQTNRAPSSMDLTTEAAVGVAFATSGYAAVLPDYLGLGDSPGLHPYHHARSQATVAVDLLRAARTFSSTNAISLTNRVFLCGYSQGGHATLGLLRELETFHAEEFKVAACAPMAGSYDMSGVAAADFLSTRPKPNPYYLLYLLAAYQDVYKLAPTLADLLVPPYNTTLPTLLRSNATGGQLNAAMPADPLLILKPEYLAEFRENPRHPLRLALTDNDVYRWRPKAALKFFHCDGDQDVVVANTQVAVAYLQAQGRTDVTWENPVPGAGHSACSQPSMLAAKLWFDSLR